MPTKLHSGQVSGTGMFQVEKSQAGYRMQPQNDLPRLVRRSVRSPSLQRGHLTPIGIDRVPLQAGYVVHARNSPKRPVLMTMADPHRWHFSSVGRSGTLSFRSDFT